MGPYFIGRLNGWDVECSFYLIWSCSWNTNIQRWPIEFTNDNNQTSVIFVWNHFWWLIESIKIWYYTSVAQLIKQMPLLTDSPRIILNKKICITSNFWIHWIVLEWFSPISCKYWFGYWPNVHTIVWRLYSTINKISSGWTDCSP